MTDEKKTTAPRAKKRSEPLTDSEGLPVLSTHVEEEPEQPKGQSAARQAFEDEVAKDAAEAAAAEEAEKIREYQEKLAKRAGLA